MTCYDGGRLKGRKGGRERKGWVCMSFQVWRQEKGGKGGREGKTWMQIEGETDKREGERKSEG